MTSSAAEAEARIDLLSGRDGGLDAGVPSGTHSILLGFGDAFTTNSITAHGWLGAVIETMDGAPLQAGSRGVAVRIKMWAMEPALRAAVLDAPFAIWYGRIVGRGRVTRAASFESHASDST